MPERRTTRVGIKYGDFVFVRETIVEKHEPVKQVEDKDTEPKQLIARSIDTYA